MDSDTANEILGSARYEHDSVDRTAGPGIGTGLAWTPTGGELLFIECSLARGTGTIQLTGQLGDVMKESARLAMSWLKANSSSISLVVDMDRIDFGRSRAGPAPGKDTATFNQADEKQKESNSQHLFAIDNSTDLHLHVPAGGTPKDGPSAGVAIVATLISLFTKWSIDPFTAMTGEITLRGRVLPVGGIRDKVLAASRGGIKTVILPRRNERDLAEIPAEVLESMRFVLADSLVDVVQELFPCRAGSAKMDCASIPSLEASL
jgi:ATP-dependent Lon protease